MVLEKRRPAIFRGHRKVASDFPFVAVEDIQACPHCDPECSVLLFDRRLYLGIQEAGGIAWFVLVTHSSPGGGVQPAQATRCGQPYRPLAILINVKNRTLDPGSPRIGGVVRDSIVGGIVLVETCISANPQLPGAVLIEGRNCVAAETIRISWVVPVLFEMVAVISPQTIHGAKPNKSSIVLQNLGELALQQTLLRG